MLLYVTLNLHEPAYGSRKPEYSRLAVTRKAIRAIDRTNFSCAGNLSKIAIIIREAIMIEHELGNWKDFIEDMLRK